MDISVQKQQFEVKNLSLNEGFVSYKHTFFHKMFIDVMWIIVMFLSAVWTLVLTAPIHWWASDAC